MLVNLRALGETMGAFKLRTILRYHVVDRKWGTYSDQKRPEDLLSAFNYTTWLSGGVMVSQQLQKQVDSAATVRQYTVTHKLDNWCTMHTAVVCCAVWLIQAQSLSLCSDQVLSLWNDFGKEDDKAMLNSLKVLGETMGAFKSGLMLKHQVVFKKWGTDSDQKRLEDMMEVI